MFSRFVLAALFASATALYSPDDDVVQLTTDNFQSEVLDSDSVWLVEFYAPWCGHCKNLVPEWKKAATALKGIAKIGAVDMTEHEEVGKPYEVASFPTLKVFGADKETPTAFEGERSAKAIVVGALKAIKEVARSRLGLKKPGKKKAKKTSDVVVLTAESFQTEVMESEELWLVEFFAPWCGHCKNLAPHWKKAATQLKGKAKLGEVDATVHSSLAQEYEVSGYPTIKVFPAGPKGEAEPFNGGRTAEAIVSEVLGLLGEEAPEEEQEDMGSVVILTADNFQEKVIDSDDLYIVEFFAPWCGHCKNLKPEWIKAAGELEGTLFLGALDCTAHNDVCQQYDVSSFPTLKIFAPGSKDAPTDYEGGRVASSIVAFGTDLAEVYSNPPSAVQLTGNESLDEGCGSKSLCLMVFLPHILDTGAQGRQDYLDMLNKIAMVNYQAPIGYVWSEAVSQGGVEEVLGVGGGGYPDVAAVSLKKGRAARFSGQFSVDGLNEFIARLLKGKERTFPVAALPDINTLQPWDGQDGHLKEEL